MLIVADFLSEGFDSLTGDPNDQQSVKILRDTVRSQSIIQSSNLPISTESSCHSSVIVRGDGMTFVLVPLHKIHVQSSRQLIFLNCCSPCLAH